MLPILAPDDPKKLKSILEGCYELRVVKVVDISKPTAKPVDEIDEPENEDLARENRMNQSNARMYQLTLRDDSNTEILAIETERIKELDDVKPNYMISIDGPVEVRCGNLMLETRHVTGKQQMPASQIPMPPTVTLEDSNHEIAEHQGGAISPPEPERPGLLPGHNAPPDINRPAIINQLPEDWDDLEEEDDDCIILE